jgi:hypothetical protein
MDPGHAPARGGVGRGWVGRGVGLPSPCRYVPVCPFQVECRFFSWEFFFSSLFSRLGLWNRSWAEPDFLLEYRVERPALCFRLVGPLLALGLGPVVCWREGSMGRPPHMETDKLAAAPRGIKESHESSGGGGTSTARHRHGDMCTWTTAPLLKL